jgi:AraC-like DNA-binding protein
MPHPATRQPATRQLTKRLSATLRASTDQLPAADRFPYWADVVAQTFVPLECDTRERRAFSGSIRHRRIGRIGITDVSASAQRVRRTRSKIAQAPRDDLIVVVSVVGQCNVGQRSNAASLSAGDGAIVSAQEPYFFEFPDAFRQLVLKVPSQLLRAPAGYDHSLRIASGPANLLRHLSIAVLESPEHGAIEEEAAIERAIMELLRSAAVPEPAPGLAANAATARYAQACAYIQRNLSDPALGPAALAAHVGLSARSLARLFAMNGETIERSIWRRRLAAARDDLANLDLRHRSITDIAFACGFNDAAHFSRSFSNAYGLTPRQFRAKAES